MVYVPGLVGEGMIVQPLVGQHASQNDQPEWGAGLHCFPVETFTNVSEESNPET
jgi:hypothetical protein